MRGNDWREGGLQGDKIISLADERGKKTRKRTESSVLLCAHGEPSHEEASNCSKVCE